MLEIKNVVKTYGEDTIACNNISLNIEENDIFGFIGHNGAGKTTLIKCIAGIHPFDSGDISLNSISILQNEVAVKKQIAYIPDNPEMYPFLSGIKYLNFIANMYDISASEAEPLIYKYAEMFELRNDLAATIDSYSRGMKQKLAVISALIRKPKLIILDEPFVGLDPKASHTLKTIMKEFEGAIFFSTHVLEVAEKLCNKVAIIKKGNIIKVGTVEEVKGDSSLEELFLETLDE